MALSKVYTDMILGHDLEVTGDITANSLEVTGDIKANALEVTGDITANSLEVTGDIKANALEVTGDITANAFIGDGSALTGIESVPSGLIAMWYGSVASIPAGYFLCDGANGTPDLRDRFIRGAGSTYNPGDKGGANSFTLSTANLPAHTHSDGNYAGSGNTSNNGAHNHGINGGGAHGHSLSNNGAHTHNITPEGNGNSGVWASEAGVFIQNRKSSSAGNHNHNINNAGNHGHNTNSAGNHNHSFSVNVGGNSGSTGSGTSFAVAPLYYALAYIMKG